MAKPKTNKLPPDTYGRLEALGLKWFTASPYPYFIVCFDPQDEDMVAKLAECFPDWNREKEIQQGVAIEYHAADVKLVFVGVRRNQYWRTTIVHEIVHVKNYIGDTLGIEWDVNNDEPEAYFVGWLFNMMEQTFQDLGYGKKSKG